MRIVKQDFSPKGIKERMRSDKLEHVSLNQLTADDFTNELQEIFSQNKNITSIYCNKTNSKTAHLLTDVTCQKMVEMLKHNRSVLMLNIDTSQLTQAGFLSIAELIQTNENLLKIYISHTAANRFSLNIRDKNSIQCVAQAFQHAIENNNTLVSLSFPIQLQRHPDFIPVLSTIGQKLKQNEKKLEAQYGATLNINHMSDFRINMFNYQTAKENLDKELKKLQQDPWHEFYLSKYPDYLPDELQTIVNNNPPQMSMEIEPEISDNETMLFSSSFKKGRLFFSDEETCEETMTDCATLEELQQTLSKGQPTIVSLGEMHPIILESQAVQQLLGQSKNCIGLVIEWADSLDAQALSQIISLASTNTNIVSLYISHISFDTNHFYQILTLLDQNPALRALNIRTVHSGEDDNRMKLKGEEKTTYINTLNEKIVQHPSLVLANLPGVRSKELESEVQRRAQSINQEILRHCHRNVDKLLQLKSAFGLRDDDVSPKFKG